MTAPDSATKSSPGRVNTWVDRDVFDRLVSLADSGMRSVSAEVRLALKAWVENADTRSKP